MKLNCVDLGFYRRKAEGSPDEKFFTAKHESLAFPYTPHPYTPTPTFKSEGRRDLSLIRMPEPFARARWSKGLRPPPNIRFGGSHSGGVESPSEWKHKERLF